MQSQARITNLLLGAITVCLALIVWKLYAPGVPVAEAVAAENGETQLVTVGNVPLPVRLVGDEPLRVQLYWHDAKQGWLPMGVDSGALMTRQ